MGIGNLGALATEFSVQQLITPHGDRKPEAGIAAWVIVRHNLITPHGDRKPPVKHRWTAEGSSAHYPSWGSETRAWITSARVPTCSHYPSWGSETCGAVHAGAESSTHYPSWGSETHDVPARMRLTVSTHYPSWGSETGSRTLRNPEHPSLITPHGDRKRNRVAAVGRLNPRLITPHGDRKLFAGDAPYQVEAWPHYPSWGSETGRARGGLVNRALVLITPHGDRKPTPSRTCPCWTGELITPHGDRKLDDET